MSYWRELEAIRAPRAVLEHCKAQRRGRAEWDSTFAARIAGSNLPTVGFGVAAPRIAGGVFGVKLVVALRRRIR